MAAVLTHRQEARAAKDFKRDELNSNGWVIEGTPKGARLKKVYGV